MNSEHAPVPTFRPGLGSTLFLAAMVGAAVFTALRMVVAAWYMSLADFATYTTIVATAAFLSTAVSFGTLESTVKNFPRLVGVGREADILPTSHLIMRRLFFRALLFGIPTLLLSYALDAEWLRLIGIAFLFSLNTSYTGLLASMQRASGTPASQAQGTVLRAIGVFAAVSFAARSGNLTTVLLAEALATLLTCRLSEWLFFKRKVEPSTFPTPQAPLLARAGADGIRLFLVYSCIAMPTYLDRLFVTSVLGAEDGAHYATMALFLTGASLLIGTLAQRSGPQAIRLVQLNGNAIAAARQIMLWCAIASVLWLCAMGTVAAAVSAQLLPPELERYFDNPTLLIPVTVIGLLLNTGLVEFLLIALDREQEMLRSAVIFASAVVATALAVAFLDLGLVDFMWLLAACRALYLVLLLSSLPWREDAASAA